MGSTIFRVVPAATVDSIMTKVAGVKILLVLASELTKGSRSGVLSFLIGVGTHMHTISQRFRSSILDVAEYPKLLSLQQLRLFQDSIFYYKHYPN